MNREKFITYLDEKTLLVRSSMDMSKTPEVKEFFRGSLKTLLELRNLLIENETKFK